MFTTCFALSELFTMLFPKCLNCPTQGRLFPHRTMGLSSLCLWRNAMYWTWDYVCVHTPDICSTSLTLLSSGKVTKDSIIPSIDPTSISAFSKFLEQAFHIKTIQNGWEDSTLAYTHFLSVRPVNVSDLQWGAIITKNDTKRRTSRRVSWGSNFHYKIQWCFP